MPSVATRPAFGTLNRSQQTQFMKRDRLQAREVIRQSILSVIGKTLSTAPNAYRHQACLEGLAEGAAEALALMTFSGKTLETGLSDLALVQLAFDDEITEQHDVYQRRRNRPFKKHECFGGGRP